MAGDVSREEQAEGSGCAMWKHEHSLHRGQESPRIRCKCGEFDNHPLFKSFNLCYNRTETFRCFMQL